MANPLRELKQRISERHMGRGGIHAIGLRASENALCVYVDPGAHLEGTDILRQIEREAAPLKILLIEEERPSIRPLDRKK